MVVASEMDLIKTIEDDEEVENLSEDSEAEIEVNWDQNRGDEIVLNVRNFISVSTNETKAIEEGALREWFSVRFFRSGVQQRHMG